MISLFDRIREIERELHTLETATPRNSATVDRGGLSVVGEGSITLEAGGTVRFDDGGSATTPDFDITEGTGWKIGTERRGSSVVVINDALDTTLNVTTANSSADYEEVTLDPLNPLPIGLEGHSLMTIQLYHVSEVRGEITVGDKKISPSSVMKSRKDQWVYTYMGSLTEDITAQTDLAGVSLRILRLTVNNVS